MQNSCLIYEVDAANRIVSISESWQEFADNNKANHLTATSVLEKSVLDFVADARSRHLYQLLIDKTRNRRETIKFHFRCDSPAIRRFMLMQISPLQEGNVEFKSCIVREEERRPVMLLEQGVSRSDEILAICGWCKKIKLESQDWVEVENALEQLGLFSDTLLPKLSHVICPTCFDKAKSELEE